MRKIYLRIYYKKTDSSIYGAVLIFNKSAGLSGHQAVPANLIKGLVLKPWTGPYLGLGVAHIMELSLDGFQGKGVQVLLKVVGIEYSASFFVAVNDVYGYGSVGVIVPHLNTADAGAVLFIEGLRDYIPIGVLFGRVPVSAVKLEPAAGND